MRDRWPLFVALAVSSLAVLATGVTAGLAFAMGTEPAAVTLGGVGVVAASAGLLAVIRWMLDAEETYPDYRYRRAVAAGPAPFATAIAGSATPVARLPLLWSGILDDNVVVFDPNRARRKKQRPR